MPLGLNGSIRVEFLQQEIFSAFRLHITNLVVELRVRNMKTSESRNGGAEPTEISVMKRALLFVAPVALISLTGCGGGLFHRGDNCANYGNYSPCSTQQVCHSGVLGGTIVDDGAIIEGGAPLPGPAREVVPGGRANP